jgi:hypothetical protein
MAVRAGDPPVSASDAASLRAALLGADAIFVPDIKTSTAGIHVARVLRQLDIEDEVAARLRIYPNGATAMRHLAGSDALRPVGCTQSTEIISTGRSAVGIAAAGMRTCDDIYRGRGHPRRPRAPGAALDRFTERPGATRVADPCGLSGCKKIADGIDAFSAA